MLLKEAQSIREIHRLTGINRTTIKSYMERFKRSDRTFEDLLPLPDDKLSRLLHPPRSTCIIRRTSNTKSAELRTLRPPKVEQEIRLNLEHFFAPERIRCSKLPDKVFEVERTTAHHSSAG